MKTIKKVVVLLVVLPFFYATTFALNYFEVSKPDIKKAKIFVSASKETRLNSQFVSQIKDMLESVLLFENVSTAKGSDYSIQLGNSVEGKEVFVTIKGVKQSSYKEKSFGIKFKNTDVAYVGKKTAQMANRIIKELFGIEGSLGSTLVWSVTEGPRKVMYKNAFMIPDTKDQITYNFYSNYGASWNQAKDHVIYTSHTDFGTVISLQKIDPLIYKAEEIFKEGGTASSPFWAPDGSVYMTLHVADQNSDIFRFRLTGNIDNREAIQFEKVGQMTYNPTIDTEPVVSPDNSKLAFVSDQTSEPQIYLLDLNTKKSSRFTHRGGYNTSPSWSPNGKYLAFKSLRGGESSIYRINVENGKEKRLTGNGLDAEEPTWSSDGSLIAFTGKTSKKAVSKIYYMLASGGDYKRLTSSSADVVESSPTWGPALR
jgi:TolB protein